MTEGLVIRPMSLDERAVWEDLWDGYLTFYKTSVPKAVKDTTWARLHDPSEPMNLLCALYGERIVGIVHYIFHRSCWTIGNYVYLQDLFVREDARGLGAGGALIKAVEKEARSAGASRVHWLTHESNAQARILYDQVAERSGFIQYRIVFK